MVPITIRFVILFVNILGYQAGILGKFQSTIEGGGLGGFRGFKMKWPFRPRSPEKHMCLSSKNVTPLLKKCTLHVIIKHGRYIAQFLNLRGQCTKHSIGWGG